MSDSTNRSGPSRADLLRQKRQQTDRERANNVRQQVVRPGSGAAHVPPQPARPQAENRNGAPAPRNATVHVSNTTARRTTPYAMPNVGATRTAPARKLHYARGANGVEVRMPAMPALQFNWQVASIFLAFGLLILVFVLVNSSAFRVSAVQLKGAKRVTAADVQPVVQSLNHSIFTLDRHTAIDTVQTAFPEFSRIDLSVSLPDTVDLSVTERQPILAWVNGNQTQWISADGVVMPARGDGGSLVEVQSSVAIPGTTAATTTAATSTDASTSATAVPTATATPEASAATDTSTSTTAAAPAVPVLQHIDPQILQAAISLSAQMPSGSSLIYDPISGMGWADPQGWKVFFGVDLSDVALKEAEYQAIVQRLTDLGIKPSLISVARLDAPYYRTE